MKEASRLKGRASPYNKRIEQSARGLPIPLNLTADSGSI